MTENNVEVREMDSFIEAAVQQIELIKKMAMTPKYVLLSPSVYRLIVIDGRNQFPQKFAGLEIVIDPTKEKDFIAVLPNAMDTFMFLEKFNQETTSDRE